MPTDTTNCLIQYAVSRNAKAVCIRFREGDAWGAWQRIDNYGTSTAAELASLLGCIQYHYQINGGDFDDYTEIGHCYYTLSGAQTQNHSHRPTGLINACCLYVLRNREQIVFDCAKMSSDFWFRGWDNGFGMWKKVTGTVVEYAT